MANFSKLSGVIGGLFQLDKTKQSSFASGSAGPNLVNQAGDLFIANAAATGPAQVVAQVLSNSNNVLVTQAMLVKRFLVTSSFNSSSIPNNSSSPGFLLCHTGGSGGYSAGDLAYDNGANDGSPVIHLPVSAGYLITIGASATTAGTIPALAAASAYIWDGSAYVKLAAGEPAGLVKSIKVPFAYTDGTVTSTATIPANATILRSSLRVTTGFDDAAATVEVGRSGSLALLQATTDNVLGTTGSYLVESTSSGSGWGGSANAVVVTVSPGSATTGSSYVVVEYSTPES